MSKRLITIDLDGATLNQDSTIIPKTKETLKKAINAGHHVSIATERPLRMSHQFYQQLELTTPMVNFNGILVHIPNQHWDNERKTSVNREIASEILSQKKQSNLDFITIGNRDTFFIDSFDFFNEKIFASSCPGEKNLLSPKNLIINPTSLLVRTDKRFVEAVSVESTHRSGSYVDVRTWSGSTVVLEVVLEGIQKAKGVQRIANYLSTDQQGVIAFGDEHNDSELLDYVGWRVTMANGIDQLKDIASDVTPLSN